MLLEKNSDKKIDTTVKFEHKLAAVLTAAKFSINIKQARQIIAHGHVLVNNRTIRDYNYTTLHGDKIKINPHTNAIPLIRQNLRKASYWPLPPRCLQINYETLTIITLWGSHPPTQGALFLLNINLNPIKNRIKCR